MKLKHSLSVLCTCALGLAVVHAQDATPTAAPAASQPAAAPAAVPAAAPAAPAQPAFSDTQIAEELGWFYGKRMGLSELGFTRPELDAMIKGLNSAAAGQDSPYDLDKIGPTVDQFMQAKQAAYLAKMKQKSTAENAAFFAKLKQDKNVVELPDGLRYEIVKPGTGPYPKPDDTVKVNYTGTLVNGTVFDSSVERHEPATFSLKDVIPGWTEGLQKINQGGTIKLYVPPQLAYGDEPRPGIPPGSTLIFDIDLLAINPPVAATPGQPAAPGEPAAPAQPAAPAPAQQ